MRTFRRVLVFVLFVAVFAGALFATCGSFVYELVVNITTGTGQGKYFMVRYGADGRIYALSERDGNIRLSTLDQNKRLPQKRLRGERLPESYRIEDLYVSPVGDVLLYMYEYEDGIPAYVALYAGDGKQFRPLLRQELSGITADERKQSVLLSAFSSEGQIVSFFVKEGKRYSVYNFEGGEDAGLVAMGVFRLEDGYTAGIAGADGSAYVALGADLMLAHDVDVQKLQADGSIYGRMMQGDNGFFYVNLAAAALHAFDTKTGEDSVMGIYEEGRHYFDSAEVTSLCADGAGNLLVLENGRL